MVEADVYLPTLLVKKLYEASVRQSLILSLFQSNGILNSDCILFDLVFVSMLKLVID